MSLVFTTILFDGAHAISHQALYKIFQVHAYQEKATLLTQLFLAALHYENIDQLCRNFYEQKISNVHLLAPLVFEADQQGDEAAGEILSQYGKGSAGLLFAGLHRFQMTEMELEVVVSGSVFKARNSSLVKALTTELGRLVPQAKIVNAKYEPVIGALLLALEALGIKVDDPVLRNIERSAKQLNLLREG